MTLTRRDVLRMAADLPALAAAMSCANALAALNGPGGPAIQSTVPADGPMAAIACSPALFNQLRTGRFGDPAMDEDASPQFA